MGTKFMLVTASAPSVIIIIGIFYLPLQPFSRQKHTGYRYIIDTCLKTSSPTLQKGLKGS
jgi:hypothetical protein